MNIHNKKPEAVKEDDINNEVEPCAKNQPTFDMLLDKHIGGVFNSKENRIPDQSEVSKPK